MKKNKILNLLLVLSLPLMAVCCPVYEFCGENLIDLYFETSIQQTDSVAIIVKDKRNPNFTETKYYVPYVPQNNQNTVYEKDNKKYHLEGTALLFPYINENNIINYQFRIVSSKLNIDFLIDILELSVTHLKKCGKKTCTYVSKTTVNQQIGDGSIYINKK
jgi:hypothetical protein